MRPLSLKSFFSLLCVGEAVRVGPRAGRNVYPQLFVDALARDQLIAAERAALHIAPEDVQLTFLCTAIMAGCALYHSFPPYPILGSGLF